MQHPQFSQNNLRGLLENSGITCHWAGRQLGEVHNAHSGSKHTALEGHGFQDFADHMGGTEFLRSMIADYLLLLGIEVIHLLSKGQSEHHQLSPLARRESTELIYDRQA